MFCSNKVIWITDFDKCLFIGVDAAKQEVKSYLSNASVNLFIYLFIELYLNSVGYNRKKNCVLPQNPNR